MKFAKLIIIMITTVTALIVAGLAVYIVNLPVDSEPVPQQPEEVADTGRSERKVEGTKWIYTVDPTAEQEFDIRVTIPSEPGSGELIISGRGCNIANAVVFRGSAGIGGAAQVRTIAGHMYSLSHTATTMMACPDDMMSKDQAVSREMSAVFQSLGNK